MRILTLDVGNTSVDACYFDGDKVFFMGKFAHNNIDTLEGNWDRVVAVSVKASLENTLRKVFGKKLKILKLEDIPLKVDYQSPETLGIDRVLFAYGVKEFFSESAILVMAGTALVVDLLFKGVFKGGFITAGLSLKLKALNQSTEGIPSYKPEILDTFLGRNTFECVMAGVYVESLSFIKEAVRRFSHITGLELPLFITGGDGKHFSSLGEYDPIILHKAMHRLVGGKQ